MGRPESVENQIHHGSPDNFSHGDVEKSEIIGGLDELPGHQLDKQLETRHMTMIALGGALGTGLLIGTGSALAKSGPAGVLIDYTIIGLVVFTVMSALGEMVSFMPLTKGFGGYATRFLDPAVGFATGYTYCFKYMLGTANQLSAFALVMKFWVGDSVSPAVFITVALVLIVAVNSVNVRAFGEVEFWLSFFKVITMLGLILLLLVLACGGGPTGDAPGFRYWKDPGAFAEYKVEGPSGRFLGVWSAMVAAVYAYTGTELVAVTVGESKHPRLSMPKAVRLSFYRIFIFYVLAVFFLGMVLPYNSEVLAFATHSKTSAAASPFVAAIKLAKIKVLDHIINGCMILFVLSAANTDFYIASRGLYGLAVDRKAPLIFARTTRSGVPWVASIACILVCCLAYLAVSTDSATVFSYLTSCVSVFGLLVWMSILGCHISFRRAQAVQGIDPAYIPFTAPFGAIGSWIALLFLAVLIITKGAEVFVSGFDYQAFILGYIGIPVYLVLYLGYKFTTRSKHVTPESVDLRSGVPEETVAEEKERYEADLREREEANPRAYWARKLYRLVSWIF